jgi:hypothetical protein
VTPSGGWGAASGRGMRGHFLGGIAAVLHRSTAKDLGTASKGSGPALLLQIRAGPEHQNLHGEENVGRCQIALYTHQNKIFASLLSI